MSKPLFALADEYLELAKVLSDEQDMPHTIIDENRRHDPQGCPTKSHARRR